MAAVSGCAGLNQPSPDITYYTLEYAPPNAQPGQLPVVLRVERFSAAPHSSTDRMIYRDKEFERDYYTYHRWRARPADMVTYFLGRDLQAGGRFKAVLTPGASGPSTHIIEGRVDEFMEWDGDAAWESVVNVTITLLKADEPDISKRVVWQKRFSARQTCAAKNPSAVAQAMSRAMAEISSQVENEVYEALSE
jgi:ABC-type uncharacterized transport system auxiliary subunit